MKSNRNYSKEIANAALDIGAIKLSPNKPFQWASGFMMPIYNDNRKLLASYDHRMLVTEAFKDIICADDLIQFDYILGTSTAGIAPAANFAQNLNDPLIILDKGLPYVVEPLMEHKIKPNQFLSDVVSLSLDAIASTCPWGIPTGIKMANNRKYPFMYVRSSPKDHGLKQQIEGIPIAGQNVVLMDFYSKGESSYFQDAKAALEDKGLIVKWNFSKYSENVASEVSIHKKQVLVIEDLISTGGSSVAEVQSVRDLGGIVTNAFSIFNYGFKEAEDMFAGKKAYDKKGEKFLTEPCSVESLLTYGILIEVAKERGEFDNNQISLLEDWRADPWNWGEKNGFPRVEIKK